MVPQPRKIPRGYCVEEMATFALRRVYELQGAFLRLGSPRVQRAAHGRRAAIRAELERRGEELFV